MKNKRLWGILLLVAVLVLAAFVLRDAAVPGDDLPQNDGAGNGALTLLPDEDDPAGQPTADTDSAADAAQSQPQDTDEQQPQTTPTADVPVYGEYYYDLTNVVLYLEVYGELPPNYITKAEARELGWEGGSVEAYQKGAAIGGDYFGNYEGLLPEASGRCYTECDIDTNGYSSRGSRRLVFSNDGLYFYSDDHYESFTEVHVTEDYEVVK